MPPPPAKGSCVPKKNVVNTPLSLNILPAYGTNVTAVNTSSGRHESVRSRLETAGSRGHTKAVRLCEPMRPEGEK